jgi:hypothetical protein
VTSFSAQDDNSESTLEQQNKATVSRLVMAGMRLYGLQRKKKTEIFQESAITEEAGTGNSTQDDEFKLIYHQTYKGVVFAFVRNPPVNLSWRFVCLLSCEAPLHGNQTSPSRNECAS